MNSVKYGNRTGLSKLQKDILEWLESTPIGCGNHKFTEKQCDIGLPFNLYETLCRGEDGLFWSGVSKPSLSRAISRLVSRGLVVRVDRHHIRLTNSKRLIRCVNRFNTEEK